MTKLPRLVYSKVTFIFPYNVIHRQNDGSKFRGFVVIEISQNGDID